MHTHTHTKLKVGYYLCGHVVFSLVYLYSYREQEQVFSKKLFRSTRHSEAITP